MSSDVFLKIPSQTWPFLLQSAGTEQSRSIARSIYDLRLSLIIPKQSAYIRPGKWFKVLLTRVTQNTLIFTVYNLMTNTTDSIQCTKVQDQTSDGLTTVNYRFSDNRGWLDTDNCFIQVAKDIQTAQDLSLQVCASCIMVTSSQPKISISCGRVYRKGIIQSTSIKQDILNSLVFSDGYNTQVSYKKGAVYVSINPGLGTQLPFHYHYWSEYSGVSDAVVSGQRSGACSINGLTGNVLINPGPSVTIIPRLSGDTLTLCLSTAKNKQ